MNFPEHPNQMLDVHFRRGLHAEGAQPSLASQAESTLACKPNAAGSYLPPFERRIITNRSAQSSYDLTAPFVLACGIPAPDRRLYFVIAEAAPIRRGRDNAVDALIMERDSSRVSFDEHDYPSDRGIGGQKDHLESAVPYPSVS